MPDFLGGGSYQRGVIGPLHYTDDIPFHKHSVGKGTRLRLTTVKNFRGDIPYKKERGLVVDSCFDAQSGILNTDIDPPGEYSGGHDNGLGFENIKASTFYKGRAYRFDTEDSIDLPGKVKGNNDDKGSSSSPQVTNNAVAQRKIRRWNTSMDIFNPWKVTDEKRVFEGTASDDIISRRVNGFGFYGVIKAGSGDDLIDPGPARANQIIAVTCGRGSDTIVIGKGYKVSIHNFSKASDSIYLTGISDYSIGYDRFSTYLLDSDNEVLAECSTCNLGKANIIS